MNNAIIRQHTLFPYHFVVNSEYLNELGIRELGVLAAHYRNYPGDINIRKGDESNELYQHSVRTVTQTLADAGVDPTQIRVTDTLLEGDGMAYEQVLQISNDRNSPTKPLYYPVGSGSGQRGSSSTGSFSGEGG